MPKSFSAELGAWKASVERRLDNLSSGNRLDHASLDGTTLYLKGDGELGRIGRQPDGSNGVHIAKVQPPPQLTAPILTVGEQAGTCLVEWDGGTFDGRRMPLIHGHTEIWAELVGEDWSPTVAPGDTAKRVGTIRDRTGGEVVVALPQAGVWAVWLRAMGADRETAGPWSPVSQVEISPLVDTDAIEAELEDARDRITKADDRLTAGQEALTGHLANLDTRVGPALDRSISEAVTEARDNLADFRQEWDDSGWDPDAIDDLRGRQETLEGDLVTGLDDVYRDAQAYAEAQADDAVNRAAADAQTEYDRLQEIAERALSRAGDNVLEDPSFETDYWFDLWDGRGGRTYTPTTGSRTGDQALVIDGGATWYLPFDTVDVEVDDSWRLSIWYRTEGTPDLDRGSGTVIRIRGAASAAELSQVSTVLQDVGDEWTRATVTATIPEGVDAITAQMYVTHEVGALVVDDVSLQEVGAAAEALRLAEVARQQAEAAHVAAGNAVDAAANAYDAASAKSSVHWSLSAPSGTGASTDDVWWQYELRNGRRVVTGQWFWDSGVWRETEIAEEWLPLVNIGTGTYGDLSGDRLEAHTVRTNHLLVGPQNLITDPDFDTIDDGNRSTWENINGEWYVSGTSSATGRPVLRISDADAQNSVVQQVRYGSGPGSSGIIPCTPGETYKFSFNVLRHSGALDSDDYRAQFRWHDANMDGIAWSTSNWGSAPAGERLLLEATAPDGAAYFYIRFYKVGEAGGARGVSLPTLEKMTDSSLIVRGAVKAEHVDAADLTAGEAFLDHAMVNLIQGRMANFDQALIGGTLLKDNAVATRHLTVTNTEDLFSSVWLEDLLDTAYVFSPAGSSLSASAFNTRFFAEDPASVTTGSTEWGYVTLQGDLGIQVWPDRNPATNQRIAFRLGPGKGIPVRPGEQYTFRARIRDHNDGGFFDLRMALADMETGAGVTQTDAPSTSVRGLIHGADGEFVWTFTIPDNYPRMWMVPSFHSAANSSSGGRTILRPQLFRANDGKLIVDGLLQASTAELQELFFDTAVGNAIWAEAVRSRLVESQGIITEDMIATGAITTPKLTVTEEMVGEVARLLRIEAGSLASNDITAMRIVSSLIEATTYLIHNADGDVSVRLDGMSNYIAGRLHAGMNEETGIELDHGSKTRRRGLTDEGDPADVWTIQTPYINFTSGRSYEQDGNPSIYIDEGDDQGRDGMMIINPGYPVGTQIFRAKLNVVGDVQANIIEARNEIRTPVGYRLNTGSSSQPGGLIRDGARTRLEGRLPDNAGRYDTLVHGASGDVTLSAGTASRGSITYGAPTETGSRRPIVSAHVANADWGYDNWRGASASSAGASASGFRFVVRADTSNTGNVQVWLYYTALWV